MKKIGILTWYFGANYGAKAQAYALQQTIQELGYEVCMINFKPKCYKKLNYLTNTEFKNKFFHPIKLYYGIKRCKKFVETDSIFNETVAIESPSDIDRLDLDCVVLGSDAIFNILHPLFNKIYYGVGIKTEKILFSPSCEYLPTNYRLTDEIKESLFEMRALSVRDINTKELISFNIDKEPCITLDPTFLYPFTEIKSKFCEKEYILVYSFNDLNKYKNQIIQFAKEQNLLIIAIGRDCEWANKVLSAASFFEWIESFRNAEYVVTDSFHGTVFSIKNSKEMILCSHDGKVAKIQSLLQTIGVDRSFYDGQEDISSYLKTKIDYYNVQKCLEEKIKESKEYLRTSLENASK